MSAFHNNQGNSHVILRCCAHDAQLENTPKKRLDESVLLGSLAWERMLLRIADEISVAGESLQGRATTAVVNEVHEVDHDVGRAKSLW